MENQNRKVSTSQAIAYYFSVEVNRESIQTISNAKPGAVSSMYDPKKGGDPKTGKKIKVGGKSLADDDVQVGVKIESRGSESGAESWEEEEEER